MSLPLLRIAAVQDSSVAGDVAANVEVAARWALRAGQAGAAVAVLPELFLPGYDPATLRERPDDCDVTPDDPRLRPLRGAARDAAVTVLVGASVRQPDGARTLSLLLVGADGSVSVPYSKQHLWDAERAIFTAGPEGATLRLAGWDLGLGICYDGCFPEHARAATDAGALAYLCPSAYVTGSEHRRDLYYAARAIDNGVYVVFAGLSGRCGSLDFSGGTAIYDPQGRMVDRVTEERGMIVADLDPQAVDEARRINPYDRDRVADLGGRSIVTITP